MLELKADLGRLRTDMNNAVGIVDRSMASISRVAAPAKAALAGIAVGLVGGLAAGGLASAVRQIADYGGKLEDLARATGATVEQLSFLDFAATRGGASLEQVTAVVGRLQRSLADVARGDGKKAADALQQLGLSAAELSRVGLVEQLSSLGEALSAIENPAQRAAAAQALLGKGAAALLPTLLEGERGFAGFADRFLELQGAITTDQGRAFGEYGDAIDDVSVAFRGAAASIAEAFVPALTSGLNTVAQVVPFIRDTLSGFIDDLVYSFTQAQKIFVETRAALAEFFTVEGAARQNLGNNSAIQRDIAEAKRLQGVLDQIRQDSYEKDVARAADLRKKISGTGASFGDIEPGADEEAAKRTQRAAEQRAKAEADAIRQLGARLNAEKDVTEAARVRYEIEQGAYQEFTSAGKERLNTLAAELDLQKESAEVSDYLRGIERQRREDAEAASQARNDEVRRTIESLRTPTEQYGDEVQRLLDLGLAGEDLARGIAKARESFESATKAVEDTTSAADELGLTFSSAFEDAIVSGNSLRDVLTGLGQDILRIAVRKTVTEPLGDAFSGLLSSSFGGTSGGGGGFSGFLSGLFGNAKGGLYRVGGSGGGEMPVAFTARAGEVVAVGTGMEGGGGMHVVVNNYSNANVQTRERRNPNGRRELEVAVGELVQSNVAAGRTSGIGLVPPLVSR